MTVFTLVPKDNATHQGAIVLEKAETVVGRRTPDSIPDIEINGPGISRRHLVLRRERNKLIAVNPGSRDIRINGEPLADQRQLLGGECIELLDLSFNVRKDTTAAPKRRFLVIAACVLAVAVYIFMMKNPASGPADPAASAPVTAFSDGCQISKKEHGGPSLSYAAMLFHDRNSHPANRFLACAAYKEMARSGASDSARTYFEQIVVRLETELDSLYHEYRDLADISYRQKQYGASRRYLNEILRMIPDVRDARYVWAATTLERISGK